MSFHKRVVAFGQLAPVATEWRSLSFNGDPGAMPLSLSTSHSFTLSIPNAVVNRTEEGRLTDLTNPEVQNKQENCDLVQLPNSNNYTVVSIHRVHKRKKCDGNHYLVSW